MTKPPITVMAFQLTEVTDYLICVVHASPLPLRDQESPGPCFKCGRTGHWAQACPNPHLGPMRPCPRCHREGHCVADCPCIYHDMETSNPENFQVDVLCPAINTTVLGWPISFLLDPRVTYSVLREFWGPTFLSSFPIVGVGTALSTSADPTT